MAAAPDPGHHRPQDYSQDTDTTHGVFLLPLAFRRDFSHLCFSPSVGAVSKSWWDRLSRGSRKAGKANIPTFSGSAT